LRGRREKPTPKRSQLRRQQRRIRCNLLVRRFGHRLNVSRQRHHSHKCAASPPGLGLATQCTVESLRNLSGTYSPSSCLRRVVLFTHSVRNNVVQTSIPVKQNKVIGNLPFCN